MLRKTVLRKELNGMRRYFVSVLSLLILMVCTGSALAEVTVVKAEGSAVKGEDEALTKRAALEDALKGAVARAVNSVLKDEKAEEISDLLEVEIYSTPMRYVLNYRILSEGWITHFDLPEDFLKPEEIEEVVEEGVKLEDLEYHENVGGGAEEVDPETPQWPEGPAGAEVEAAAPESARKDLGAGGVVLYHLWIEASVDIGELKKDIGRFADIEEQETTTVEVVMLDVPDYRSFESLKKRLEEMDIIKGLSFESFSKGRYVLSAAVAGDGHALYDSLVDTLGKDYILIPGGTGRVIIKVDHGAF